MEENKIYEEVSNLLQGEVTEESIYTKVIILILLRRARREVEEAIKTAKDEQMLTYLQKAKEQLDLSAMRWNEIY